MNKRRMELLLLTTIILVAISYVTGLGQWAGSLLPVRVDAADIEPDELLASPQTEAAIQLFEQRITQNPQDAVSLSILGRLYAQQAWQTDDVELYQQAALTQEKALVLLPGYDPARISLAASLLALHQFEDAYALGQSVYNDDPKRIDALATAGDAALALGRYDEAENIYQQLNNEAPSPLIDVRLAHLAELHGRPQEAIDLIQRATQASLSAGQDQDQIAWYLFRLGDLYFDTGRFDEARSYIEAALNIWDDYVPALSVMAELETANGRYDEAIAYHKRVNDLSESIGTLATIADLYALTGRPAQAEIYYDAVQANFGELALEESKIYGREMAAYYADHNLNLAVALALIEADLEQRQDIHGYDTAAWVYYKLGRFDKAQEMINQALQLETQEAEMLYHAGMIALARGETAEAVNLLTQTLDINPAFDPIQANIARQTLRALQ